MIKKHYKTIMASVLAVAYIIAATTACNSGVNNNDLSSVATTVENQTSAPESQQTTTSSTGAETSAPETEQTTTSQTEAETSSPKTEQTTTSQTEAETSAPETTTTAQTTLPQTEAQTTTPVTTAVTTTAPEETVEKLNKVMYAMGAVCSYEQNTIKFSDPVDKYYMNDEVTVVEKVAGMYNGKGFDEGYFYKLDDGTYVPAAFFTDNKNWQAETTFQTYDWTPDDPGVPMLPPSNQFIGDLFD